MSKVPYWRSAALAILAASTALAAVPAQAQDGRGGWRDRTQQGESRSDSGAGEQPRWQPREGGDWRARIQARQEQRAAQAQPQDQARSVEQDGLRRDRADESRQSWRGGERATGSWRDERRWSDRDRADRTYRGGVGDRARQDWRGGYRGDQYGGYAYRNDYRRDRGWDNNWRRDRRYDWQGYRGNNRQVYSLGRYYAPYRDYSNRRLGVGLFVQPLFYSHRYWIADPWQYRLPEVDGPYRWVRYYDDVLLIDTYSSRVVDVIYDFFW